MVWEGDSIMLSYMIIIYAENKRTKRMFFKTDNLFIQLMRYKNVNTRTIEVYIYQKNNRDYVYKFTLFFDRGLE